MRRLTDGRTDKKRQHRRLAITNRRKSRKSIVLIHKVNKNHRSHTQRRLQLEQQSSKSSNKIEQTAKETNPQHQQDKIQGTPTPKDKPKTHTVFCLTKGGTLWHSFTVLWCTTEVHVWVEKDKNIIQQKEFQMYQKRLIILEESLFNVKTR